MFMKNIYFFIALAIVFSGCEYNKSVNKDLLTGIIVKGNGISVEDTYLSIDDKKITRTNFIFGEKFFLNFDDIQGLKKENGRVFPGMKILVISSAGDTVVKSNDLFIEYDKKGISRSPLMLMPDITIGKPMKSGIEYTFNVYLWDKKGTGSLTSNFKFKVEANKNITVEKIKANCNEIYLFSKENNKVINNKLKSNETAYMNFEGITGFLITDGRVFPGLSVKLTDNKGHVLYNEKDLLESGNDGFSAVDFEDKVFANINLSKNNYKGNFSFEVVLWDKKSDAKITAKALLTAE